MVKDYKRLPYNLPLSQVQFLESKSREYGLTKSQFLRLIISSVEAMKSSTDIKLKKV